MTGLITRKEYKEASATIRKLGIHAALEFLNPRQEIVLSHLRLIQKDRDPLADRASTIAWCKESGTPYDFRLLNLFTWFRTKS